MSRIEARFQSRDGKRAALIPFLNAGDPTQDISIAAFQSVLDSGADMVEIGIPYSDPLADGPVIQASALRSLSAGFSLPRAFDIASTLRKHSDAGLILFTYVNPVIQYGIDRFFADAKAAGADGAIIPDLPSEESPEFLTFADHHGIDLIPLLAPTSGEARIQSICQQARGFIYCVSSLGVTGERARMSNRLQDMVSTVRRYSALPVSVGFGVNGPESAKNIAQFADGVIVGSAYVRRINEAVQETSDDTDRLVSAVQRNMSTFTQQLVDAVR